MKLKDEDKNLLFFIKKLQKNIGFCLRKKQLREGLHVRLLQENLLVKLQQRGLQGNLLRGRLLGRKNRIYFKGY